MKKVLALCLLLAACATTTGAKKDRDVDTVGRAFHNTVALQNESGRTFCSGVIVDHRVLTAWHCVEDGDAVFVETIDGRWEAALDTFDLVQDLAVLVPADGRDLPKGVRLARKAPGFADDVWVIGHALGEYDYSVTKGIVSHPRRENGIFGGLWFQHDAGSIGGNSGGPVLNSRGRLVGIVSFGVISSTYCAGLCIGRTYQDTHMKGAVHYDSVRSILSR
jgi:S1-C subfamily serine protease